MSDVPKLPAVIACCWSFMRVISHLLHSFRFKSVKNYIFTKTGSILLVLIQICLKVNQFCVTGSVYWLKWVHNEESNGMSWHFSTFLCIWHSFKLFLLHQNVSLNMLYLVNDGNSHRPYVTGNYNSSIFFGSI